MAVTLSVTALSDNLGGDMATVERLHAVALALVDGYAAGCPSAIGNEAMLRVAGFLHADEPAFKVLRRMAVDEGLTLEPRAAGSALRLSGAMALLAPYRVRRDVTGAPS